MISVQATGCAPIVRAFYENAPEATPWENPSTIASGLRVPAAVGDRLMLRAIRQSQGTAVAVPDDEMLEGARLLGRSEGILSAPEGGALVAAARRLLAARRLDPEETVVLFNTGTALSYLEAYARV